MIRVIETAPKSSVPEEIITPMLPQVEDELPIGRERERDPRIYEEFVSPESFAGAPRFKEN